MMSPTSHTWSKPKGIVLYNNINTGRYEINSIMLLAIWGEVFERQSLTAIFIRIPINSVSDRDGCGTDLTMTNTGDPSFAEVISDFDITR